MGRPDAYSVGCPRQGETSAMPVIRPERLCALNRSRESGTTLRRARSPLAVVVVSPRAVVAAATHTALLEICVPNHKGRDHFGPASQRALYPRVQRGNPRFTFVSEGKPLRRLLVFSYRNSSFTAFLLPDGFARHITEEEDHDYCKPEPGRSLPGGRHLGHFNPIPARKTECFVLPVLRQQLRAPDRQLLISVSGSHWRSAWT